MANIVLMCKIGVKYLYASQGMCAYVFGKRPGCELIGACALIRMNTVINFDPFNLQQLSTARFCFV